MKTVPGSQGSSAEGAPQAKLLVPQTASAETAAFSARAVPCEGTVSDDESRGVAALAAGIFNAARSSLTPQIVAAIAAAVKCTLGNDARILFIQHQGTVYAQGGRSCIMSSHTQCVGNMPAPAPIKLTY